MYRYRYIISANISYTKQLAKFKSKIIGLFNIFNIKIYRLQNILYICSNIYSGVTLNIIQYESKN